MSKEQAVVKTPQPGDTVDPRTLPVGAVFRHVEQDYQYRVTEAGVTAESVNGRFKGLNIGSMSAILLSLPTPKRPPCDACGEESCPNPTCKGVETWQSEFGPAHLCRECWGRRQEQLDATIRASRTAQTSPAQLDPSTLPTYDQISGWLGAEWTVMRPFFDGPAKPGSPWWITYGGEHDGRWRCYLRHTSGQRVEVTAPMEPITVWDFWFRRIKRLDRGEPGLTVYQGHVRWLDPDAKTSTGSEESATRKEAESSPSPSKDGGDGFRAPQQPVVPPHCSSCNQPFWAGRTEAPLQPQEGGPVCGDCHANGCGLDLRRPLDTRIAEVRPEPVRIEDMPGAWQSPNWEDVS